MVAAPSLSRGQRWLSPSGHKAPFRGQYSLNEKEILLRAEKKANRGECRPHNFTFASANGHLPLKHGKYESLNVANTKPQTVSKLAGAL